MALIPKLNRRELRNFSRGLTEAFADPQWALGIELSSTAGRIDYYPLFD